MENIVNRQIMTAVDKRSDAIVRGVVPIFMGGTAVLACPSRVLILGGGTTNSPVNTAPAPPKSLNTNNCDMVMMLVRWIIPQRLLGYINYAYLNVTSFSSLLPPWVVRIDHSLPRSNIRLFSLHIERLSDFSRIDRQMLFAATS